MSPRLSIRPVLVGVAVTVAGLALAAGLTPDQSPILPIEISIVLALLAGWVGLRSSRAAFAAVAVFTLLLTVLSIHILVGDLDASTGARELVPDVIVLASAAVTSYAAGRCLLRKASVTA
jgi:hypothetical protein